MAPVLRLLNPARDGSARRLRGVRPGDWARLTPCSKWNVRLLVNHVIGRDFGWLRLQSGGIFQESLATRGEEMIGGDPVGAWKRDSNQLNAAAKPAALDPPIRHRTGETIGREFLQIRVFNMTVQSYQGRRRTQPA